MKDKDFNQMVEDLNFALDDIRKLKDTNERQERNIIKLASDIKKLHALINSHINETT